MNLIKFYLALNWRRDLMIMVLFAVATVALCIISGHTGGTVRHDIACFWAIASAVYAWVTVFEGYHDPSRSMTTLLLPANSNGKFFVELLRVVVVVPLIFMAIAMTICMVMTRGGESLTECFFYRASGLHRICVIPYYMLWFTSLAVMCRTFGTNRKSMMACMVMILIAIVSTMWLPHGGDTSCGYPFINRGIMIANKSVLWQSLDSWTGLSVRVQRLISYAWLTMLPSAALLISYFRFKETESK